MMKKSSAAWSGLGALAVAGVLAACGGPGPGGAAGQAAAASASGPVISARKLAGIGTVLTDRSGRTIYSPVQEAHGKILCTGSCLSFWFPVSVAAGTPLRPPAGLSGALGTVHRGDDGLTQLTYNGRPLYTFRLDQAAGQAHGNNFSDRFGSTSFTWQAVAASGQPAAHSQPPPPDGYSYPGGGSPGYGG